MPPTYFYHLKFELYPAEHYREEEGEDSRKLAGGFAEVRRRNEVEVQGGSRRDKGTVGTIETRGEGGKVYVPGAEEDIFRTEDWPDHRFEGIGSAGSRTRAGARSDVGVVGNISQQEGDSIQGLKKAPRGPGRVREGGLDKTWATNPDSYSASGVGYISQTVQSHTHAHRHTPDLETTSQPRTISRSAFGKEVIDCGPARGLITTSTYNNDNSTPPIILPTTSTNDTGFLPPNPSNIKRDLNTVRQDWRFGPVRIESWDLDNNRSNSHFKPEGTENTGDTMERPGLGHRRGESSAGLSSAPQAAVSDARVAGINAGLSSGGVGNTGRVTKARFEEGKNTEVGWGIVHLYRDGEETLGLGSTAEVEVYSSTHERNASSGGVSAERKSFGDAEKGDGIEEDCTTLCIPAVPSYLTPSDFLGFVGEKTREEVSHFRMVMTGRMNRYLVLMKFRDGSVAKKWKAEWDGKVFNSMEPETCHVTFIKSITFQTSATTSSHSANTSFPELSHDPFTPSPSTYLKPFPPPTPNLVELPTCPVCLERMDDTTGLLTILCQHVFHCSCLQKWRGSGCPVCRHTNPSPAPNSPSYDPSNPPFGSGEASLCSVCDCTDDLWICLICGYVGCGRYKGGHAKEHWKESAHNFALEIETQHVWDYAGDLWVHRLIRSKGDGKVVELPSRSLGGAGGRDEHEDMVPREKSESIGMEYTHLLTSQLESQRVYFEELVGKAVAKASAASSSAAAASQRAEEAHVQLSALVKENTKLREEVIVALEKDLARERRKAEKSAEVARGFGKSLMEEKKVSEGLMERIGHLNEGVKSVSEELMRVKEECGELRETNRDLLFSIEAGEKLRSMVREGDGEAAGGGEGGEEGLLAEELEGGTLSLPEPSPASANGKRRKGKGKR